MTDFTSTGNGEIDFTEFLTLMTSTERYLETLRGENLRFCLVVVGVMLKCPSQQCNLCNSYHLT